MNEWWISINRNATVTRLVIPGWSILPNYFATLIPNDNLIILSPFISKKDELLTYCKQELSGENFKISNRSIEGLVSDNIDRLFIFSMGLQWVNANAPQWFNKPCDIVSPAVSYDSKELDQMVSRLKISKSAVLRSFYRRCFHSNDDWLVWKQQEYKSHVTYNNSEILIEWLDTYGRLKGDILNKRSISVWIDSEDLIGEKPVIESSQININSHSKGHLMLTPLPW